MEEKVEESRPERRFEEVIELSDLIGKVIRARFVGGREFSGVLKGFDQMQNMVVSDCVESVRDPKVSHKFTGETRELGLVVLRGPALTLIFPDGTRGGQEIPNPYSV